MKDLEYVLDTESAPFRTGLSRGEMERQIFSQWVSLICLSDRLEGVGFLEVSGFAHIAKVGLSASVS